jgi:DNA replication factor GINS
MKNLPKDDSDKVESMLNQLVRIRQGKIVRLADSSKLTADLGSKLTVEEEVFYNQINNASNEFKNQIIGNKK